MTLQDLYTIVQTRKSVSARSSYTASLFEDGLDKIAQKVGEEAVEVVIAAKNDDKELFVGEVADLYYHLIVLLVEKNISLDDILQELESRHAEKTR